MRQFMFKQYYPDLHDKVILKEFTRVKEMIPKGLPDAEWYRWKSKPIYVAVIYSDEDNKPKLVGYCPEDWNKLLPMFEDEPLATVYKHSEREKQLKFDDSRIRPDRGNIRQTIDPPKDEGVIRVRMDWEGKMFSAVPNMVYRVSSFSGVDYWLDRFGDPEDELEIPEEVYTITNEELIKMVEETILSAEKVIRETE